MKCIVCGLKPTLIVLEFGCILIAHFTGDGGNEYFGREPFPIRHMGEEVLRAPLRTGAHVNFHTQSFAPSGARTIK